MKAVVQSPFGLFGLLVLLAVAGIGLYYASLILTMKKIYGRSAQFAVSLDQGALVETRAKDVLVERRILSPDGRKAIVLIVHDTAWQAVRDVLWDEGFFGGYSDAGIASVPNGFDVYIVGADEPISHPHDYSDDDDGRGTIQDSLLEIYLPPNRAGAQDGGESRLRFYWVDNNRVRITSHGIEVYMGQKDVSVDGEKVQVEYVIATIAEAV